MGLLRLWRRAKAVAAEEGWTGFRVKAANKVFAYVAYPYYRALLSGAHFRFRGKELYYFVHPYNTTWRNERAIEIPIARTFLSSQEGRGLEVGNVLAHYGVQVASTVVDKYESYPGIVNQDIVDFSPQEPYDFILSISTFEHIGQDEPGEDPEKALEALDRCRKILRPGGQMLVTLPVGHNPALDEAILLGRVPGLLNDTVMERRASDSCVWREVDLERVRAVKSRQVNGRWRFIWVGWLESHSMGSH